MYAVLLIYMQATYPAMPNVSGGRGLDYSLRDVTGRLVSSGIVTDEGSIDISALQSAIYLLHMKHADGGKEVFKITKQ